VAARYRDMRGSNTPVDFGSTAVNSQNFDLALGALETMSQTRANVKDIRSIDFVVELLIIIFSYLNILHRKGWRMASSKS
jgi:hypothetical protein